MTTPTLHYVGEKEARAVCRDAGLAIGKGLLRKWRDTVPGLFVRFPHFTHGRYYIPVLKATIQSHLTTPTHP